MRRDELTHRRRFLVAVNHQTPDRVPACPCLSNMVPARRTGRPFWDVFLHGDPPLWQAYLETARHFDIDGRLIYGGLRFTYGPDAARVETRQEIIARSDDAIRTRTVQTTPFGQLVSETVYQAGNPPTDVVKPIKDIVGDLPAAKCLFPLPTGYTHELADAMRAAAGEDAVFCLSLGYPGFHAFSEMFDGGLEAATFAFMDHPDLFEELRATMHAAIVRKAELMLDYRPDILYFSASGTLTLSTPAWVRQFCLPTIKRVTAMARQAGVPTMLHACGKSRAFVQMLAEETDLDCINPLEMPPMGDADLAEIKRSFGHKLALAGNIHTTETMLLGSPADVDAACRRAIEAAGAGGGFVLMTGDQCGRDTPDENIFAFVEAARRYGRY